MGLVALWAVPAAQAATINVTPGAVDTTTNGNCSLIEAIQAANSGGTVDQCVGSPGAVTIDAPGTFVLTAVDNTSPSGPNGLPVIATTITIRNATITRASSAPAFRIFEVASGGNLTLDAASVAGGRVTCAGGGCGAFGGGIFNDSGSTLTVTNSHVNGNTATCSGTGCSALGGGIFDGSGTLNLNSSRVGNNTASCAGGGCGAFGGGIANEDTLNVTSSRVSNNTASCSGSGDVCVAQGGGIANSATANVNNSQVSTNTASNHTASAPGGAARGGGIYTTNGTLTLTASQVSHNRAVGATAGGAGIYHARGTVTLNRSQVAGNTPNNCEPAIGTCT
jgi:hypothetical protein